MTETNAPMGDPSSTESRRTTELPLDPIALTPLLFVLSGAAAMAYQVAWIRGFVELYGSTVESLGAVVGAFLSCLAMGALVAGRIADRHPRPLRLYALLEGLAAAGGGLAWFAMGHLEGLAVRFAEAEVAGSSAVLGRFAVALGLMLLPIGALGGTLPVLARLRVGERSRASAAGVLQVANTLGAVGGVLVGSTVLLEAFGVRGTVALAALVNALVGVAALGLARGRKVIEPEHAEDSRSGEADASAVGHLIASLLLGVATVGAEVLLFRGLSQVTRGSVDSVALLLGVFLACNALGTAFGVAWAKRGIQAARTGFVLGQAGVMFGIAVGMMVLFALASPTPPAWMLPGMEATSWTGRLLGEAFTAFLVCGPVAFALGISFPCMVQRRSRRVPGFGRWVAWLSASWTLGAALAGVGVPHFVFGRPGVGLEDGLTWLAALPVVALLLVLALERRRLWKGWWWWSGAPVAVGVLTFALPFAGNFGRVPLQFYRFGTGAATELVAYGEGRAASVAVVALPSGQKQLKVNSLLSLGGGHTAEVESMQGLLPALLHPAPKNALALGVGAGVTVGAMAQCGIQHIDAVELLPEVLAALDLFYVENGGVPLLAGRGQIDLHAHDARTFVRAAEEESYDLVVGDLFFPWLSEAGFLYTREHFQRVRDLLAPGGVFCQWLPLHQLRWEEFGMVGRTFADVFPGVTVWLARTDFPFPVVALVGGKEPLVIDPKALDERLAGFYDRDLLARHDVATVPRLLSLYWADEFLFRDHFTETTLNTKDRPAVEFSAARRIESDGVVAVQNRQLLYEVKEDVVGRMSTLSLEPGERSPLQQLLSLESKVTAERFRAASLRMAADANRSLPAEVRRNDPDSLDAEAFQVLAQTLVAVPDDSRVLDDLWRLLLDQLRRRQYMTVAVALTSLFETEPASDLPRLRNLRGMANLFAYCDPEQAALLPDALASAVDDFRVACESDPEQVEWATNFGIAAFLASRDRAALNRLHEARQKIRVEGGSENRLPAVAEAIYQYLSGERELARQILETTPDRLLYRNKVLERVRS